MTEEAQYSSEIKLEKFPPNEEDLFWQLCPGKRDHLEAQSELLAPTEG